MKCERHCEIWTFGADWKEQINEWKETEKRDWETAESECSVEGGEVGSVWKEVNMENLIIAKNLNKRFRNFV